MRRAFEVMLETTRGPPEFLDEVVCENWDIVASLGE
jgi:hypothetical protein